MAKSRKYFSKNRTHKKMKRLHKTHKKVRKSKMRKNRKLNKSKRYRLKGVGSFHFLPQDLVNTWWNTEHGLGKMMNNWRGVPTGPGPLPTEQPELLKSDPHYQRLPDLQRFNEGSDLQVSNMLQ